MDYVLGCKRKVKMCLTTKYFAFANRVKCEKFFTGENASTTYYRPTTIKINMFYWYPLRGAGVSFFAHLFCFTCFAVVKAKKNKHYVLVCYSIAFLLVNDRQDKEK